MVKRIGSNRRKARQRLTKSKSQKGKISLTRFFAKFKEGENVVLKAEPSVHKGMYHIRFHGKHAVIKCMQGRCCVVTIKDGSKKKDLIVHPVHLKRLK